MTSLGDRMKDYERLTSPYLSPLLPICVRIDGKRFSRWTRGLERPWDERMANCMIAVTEGLVDITNARIGYTQSDEITLILYSDDPKRETYLNGRVQKLASLLASFATTAFADQRDIWLDEFKPDTPAHFDARVWTVPTKTEATNVLVWRELDATRNSIESAARAHYSHNEMHGVDNATAQEMLHAVGVNWNDYADHFKRGTYIQRHRVVRAFTRGEIERLPMEHLARVNPDLEVERSELRCLQMPVFTTVTNREAVVFDGAEPETAGS